MRERTNRRGVLGWMLTALAAIAPVQSAGADPCGMVPPIWTGGGVPIARVGEQRTYCFFKDGFETLVIQPGFTGQVEEFGMLVPFPTPPGIRKVDDAVFDHVAAAIDPPEIVVYAGSPNGGRYAGVSSPVAMRSLAFDMAAKEEVVVLSEEAVGMYEVAVLSAGSAEALQRWMDDHGFKYPTGMDAACEDYVEDGWCFVAVKARVGSKSASEPRPGMREVDASRPAGSTFGGRVQAMGFRFKTDELVVPMRLSTFNEGELSNIVYVLADEPLSIRNVPSEYVVRQVPGSRLHRNLTRPLPVRVVNGRMSRLFEGAVPDSVGGVKLPEWSVQNLPQQRDPKPHNGIAAELFASDLLAAAAGTYVLPIEEEEKELLDIGERLGLRGPDIDRLHREHLAERRARVVGLALEGLEGMTLTVIDGDFPRDVLARENLRFDRFEIAAARNTPSVYDAKHLGPAPAMGGALGLPPSSPFGPGPGAAALAGLALLGLVALVASRRPRHGGLATAAAVVLFCGFAGAQVTDRVVLQEAPEGFREQVAALRSGEVVERGRAIVALSEMGGPRVRAELERIVANDQDDVLVRTWAAAALVRAARTPAELMARSELATTFPAVLRPVEARWRGIDPRAAEELELDRVLVLAARLPSLQPTLVELLRGRGVDGLVGPMFTSNDGNVRRLAAAFLATLGADDRRAVADAVLRSVRFEAGSKELPWSGGALFLPGIAWEDADAHDLVRELIAWLVWCDAHGKGEPERRPIVNNLRGQLSAHSGGNELNWNDVDPRSWLRVWGRKAGLEAARRLLSEQGLDRRPRYRLMLLELELESLEDADLDRLERELDELERRLRERRDRDR